MHIVLNRGEHPKPNENPRQHQQGPVISKGSNRPQEPQKDSLTKSTQFSQLRQQPTKLTTRHPDQSTKPHEIDQHTRQATKKGTALLASTRPTRLKKKEFTSIQQRQQTKGVRRGVARGGQTRGNKMVDRVAPRGSAELST
jgi:hypothetical protein